MPNFACALPRSAVTVSAQWQSTTEHATADCIAAEHSTPTHELTLQMLLHLSLPLVRTVSLAAERFISPWPCARTVIDLAGVRPVPKKNQMPVSRCDVLGIWIYVIQHYTPCRISNTTCAYTCNYLCVPRRPQWRRSHELLVPGEVGTANKQKYSSTPWLVFAAAAGDGFCVRYIHACMCCPYK